MEGGKSYFFSRNKAVKLLQTLGRVPKTNKSIPILGWNAGLRIDLIFIPTWYRIARGSSHAGRIKIECQSGR